MSLSNPLTVSQLTRIIRGKLESPELGRIWVTGEISSFSQSQAGHMYFSLKDTDETIIQCTFFAGMARGLTFPPENGMKVIIMGSVSVYSKRGSYQLNGSKMMPAGEGELALKLKQLKDTLQKEGLFKDTNKKPVPSVPEKIGLITSENGAAIKDFMKMLVSLPSLSVVLFPAVVQGESAPDTLIRGIEFFNSRKDIDVIVLTRGGGSEEDLFCFNNEQLARAIFSSEIPVISAVGHEKDVLISDLVADLRMPTPTAAGKYFAENFKQISMKLEKISQYLTQKMDQWRKENAVTVKLKYLTSELLYYAERTFPQKMQDLDWCRTSLIDALSKKIVAEQSRLNVLESSMNPGTLLRNTEHKQDSLNFIKNALIKSINSYLSEKNSNLNTLGKALDSMSPLKVLERGYCLASDKYGKTLKKTASSLTPGENLNLRFSDGFALCNVLYTEISDKGEK